MISRATVDHTAGDLGPALPVRVPTCNGLPVDVTVEDGMVVLRKEGRDTTLLDVEAAELLWEVLPVAIRAARAGQPDATILRLERHRTGR